MNEHIKFDTTFLENNGQSSQAKKPQMNAPQKSGGNKGKGLLTAFLILMGLGIVLSVIDSEGSYSSTSSTQTTPTNASTNNSLTYDGETFTCSDFHYNKALALRPSSAMTSQLDSEGYLLDVRISALEAESSRIESMYVDEYDQYSVDKYNSAVDAYNLKKDELESDINSWNSMSALLDQKIDTYNSYLDTNCRPAY